MSVLGATGPLKIYTFESGVTSFPVTPSRVIVIHEIAKNISLIAS